MWLLCLIFILIASVGTIGNIVVLLVIGFNRNLHDSTNILIANLALADLLFLSFCVPLTAYSYVHSWSFSESLCYYTITCQYLTAYVSVYTLVLLAYDRLLAITSPTKLRSIRRGCHSIYVCISIWIVMFFINWPNMRGVGLIEQTINQTTERYCVDSLEIGQAIATTTSARTFFWSFNLLAYLLPLTFTFIFYMLLVKALWKEKLAFSKSSQRMKRHATRMVFTVILTFGICWLPQNMRFFLRGLSYPHLAFWEENETILLMAQSFAQILAYSNSCINPILYSLLSERFRNGLKHAWRRLCSKNRRSSTDTYYRQTFYDSKTPYDSRARSPKSYSPEQRRSLSDGRYMTVKEISSIMGSAGNVCHTQMIQERSQLLFKSYKPPLVARSPIIEPESSSVRDSTGPLPSVLV
ncbi:G-PROTEIN-RECEP-F1-2 domain-containing protein [Aphelenchoides bicaudatus]|nr:G-PROTEIN-RECEP-F1-2 domain-containing protein [Aphelenchoides bicaudatus]